MSISTTKMSSRGQVVIPEDIRNALHLKEGSRFVVLHHGDSVVLKTISEPSAEEFEAMLKNVRSQVKKAGIRKSDVAKALRKVRRSK
jgi:AbrB family looped-hinge helix DNA binding protein